MVYWRNFSQQRALQEHSLNRTPMKDGSGMWNHIWKDSKWLLFCSNHFILDFTDVLIPDELKQVWTVIMLLTVVAPPGQRDDQPFSSPSAHRWQQVWPLSGTPVEVLWRFIQIKVLFSVSRRLKCQTLQLFVALLTCRNWSRRRGKWCAKRCVSSLITTPPPWLWVLPLFAFSSSSSSSATDVTRCFYSSYPKCWDELD